jgi:hypothetical protein
MREIAVKEAETRALRSLHKYDRTLMKRVIQNFTRVRKPRLELRDVPRQHYWCESARFSKTGPKSTSHESASTSRTNALSRRSNPLLQCVYFESAVAIVDDHGFGINSETADFKPAFVDLLYQRGCLQNGPGGNEKSCFTVAAPGWKLMEGKGSTWLKHLVPGVWAADTNQILILGRKVRSNVALPFAAPLAADEDVN